MILSAASGDEARRSVKRDVEAVLFAAGRPLSVDTLRAAVTRGEAVSEEAVQGALEALGAEFPPDGSRGFELVEVGGGWAFRTSSAAQEAVSALFEVPDDTARLSAAAMEVLAVIAYMQPVSRPQIAEVRGVNSDSPLQRLLERELVAEVGRSPEAGGAVLYGTTVRFEVVFGLRSLEDLPALEGFALGEGQKEELSRRLGLMTTPE
jgi:segregation and condensation protein B